MDFSDSSSTSDTSHEATSSRKRHYSGSDENEHTKKPRRFVTSHQEHDDDPLEGTSRDFLPAEQNHLGRSGTGDSSNLQERRSQDSVLAPNQGNRHPYERGTIVFSDRNVEITVQSVRHQRNTRFRTQDHLYQININPRRRSAPLLLSLERAIQEGLTTILMRLKQSYPANLHHQIYLTIIERNILHGLNTGNFDLNSPAPLIINRALTILHSYLKSKQTLRLNDSFKIQIKVLSHAHTRHMERTKPAFRKHIYQNYSRIRN